MRRLVCWLFVAAAVFAACEQDIYEKGDSATSYVQADFVEAFVNGSKQVEYVITDDGERLPLKEPYTGSWVQKADTVYRSLMYYSHIGEVAEVMSLSRVPMLSAKRDTLAVGKWKKDPVGLETIWLSRNKKYLNLGLLLTTGETADKQQSQTLGVVISGFSLNADTTRTCNMALSHWQADTPQYYTQRTYLSISVEGLEADSLCFTLNTYDGVVTKKFRIQE